MNREGRRWIVAILVVALLGGTGRVLGGAQGEGVVGMVFMDANGNGRREAGERGLGGVAVSNQDAVVVSDSSGAFRLPSAGLGVVYVTVPDGYRAVGEFWRAAAGGRALAFALAAQPVQAAQPAGREFVFVHASDTHVAEPSAPRMRRLRAMVDSIGPAFALITGDLVRDALRVPEGEARGYYELFASEAGQFATPVWTVPGNHEIFGIEPQSGVARSHPLFGKAMYRHYRGPDYYSFDHGGVHFVALNTVDIHDGRWYHGHVDSLQLAWLRRDLALVPADRPVVTFNHIPFYSAGETIGGYDEGGPAPTVIDLGARRVFRHTVANADSVLAVLRTRNHAVALGGHIHARERLQYEVEGRPLRLETSAATVGPNTGSGIRFTSGFTVYRVANGIIDAGTFVPLDPPRR